MAARTQQAVITELAARTQQAVLSSVAAMTEQAVISWLQLLSRLLLVTELAAMTQPQTVIRSTFSVTAASGMDPRLRLPRESGKLN